MLKLKRLQKIISDVRKGQISSGEKEPQLISLRQSIWLYSQAVKGSSYRFLKQAAVYLLQAVESSKNLEQDIEVWLKALDDFGNFHNMWTVVGEAYATELKNRQLNEDEHRCLRTFQRVFGRKIVAVTVKQVKAVSMTGADVSGTYRLMWQAMSPKGKSLSYTEKIQKRMLTQDLYAIDSLKKEQESEEKSIQELLELLRVISPKVQYFCDQFLDELEPVGHQFFGWQSELSQKHSQLREAYALILEQAQSRQEFLNQREVVLDEQARIRIEAGLETSRKELQALEAQMSEVRRQAVKTKEEKKSKRLLVENVQRGIDRVQMGINRINQQLKPKEAEFYRLIEKTHAVEKNMAEIFERNILPVMTEVKDIGQRISMLY
jgi:hypothetical protein